MIAALITRYRRWKAGRDLDRIVAATRARFETEDYRRRRAAALKGLSTGAANVR